MGKKKMSPKISTIIFILCLIYSCTCAKLQGTKVAESLEAENTNEIEMTESEQENTEEQVETGLEESEEEVTQAGKGKGKRARHHAAPKKNKPRTVCRGKGKRRRCVTHNAPKKHVMTQAERCRRWGKGKC